MFVPAALLVILLFIGFSLNLFSGSIIFSALCLVLIFVLTVFDVRVSLFVLLFLMIFSPELLFSDELTGGRTATFRYDDLLLVIVFLGWLAKMAFSHEKGTWRKTPLNYLLVLWIFLNIFCSINGVYNKTVAMKTTIFFTLKKVEYVCIYFLVLNNIESVKDIKFFFAVSLIICGMTCVWGYYMILSGNMPGRFYGPFDFGESNTIGAYFVMNMCLAVGLIFNYRDKIFKSMLLYGLILLILIPFALTMSRGGYTAMLFSMIFLGLMKGRKVIFIPVIVFIFLMGYLLPPEVFDRVMSIKAVIPSTHVYVQSWDDRLGMWGRAYRHWLSHPLMGNGPGAFDLGGVDNQYVMELTSVGIIGLIVFLLILGVVIYVTVRVIIESEDPFIKNITMGFLAGTVGYLVNSLSLSVFLLIRTMEPFWFQMGMIAFIYRDLQIKRDELIAKTAT